MLRVCVKCKKYVIQPVGNYAICCDLLLHLLMLSRNVLCASSLSALTSDGRHCDVLFCCIVVQCHFCASWSLIVSFFG